MLREEGERWLDRLDVVQPALFAVMVSLARLWRECGVEPAVVVGHSQGEIAAAHVAGGLSLDDAALIVALRAKAMAKIAGKGGMLSVSLAPEQLRARIEPYGQRLSLAAINGPASLVVSGEPEALTELLTACEKDGVRAQRIAVDYAAHSAQIEALREELLEAFAPISPRSGEIPMHSTVTGEPIDTAELGPEYWYRNLRETVRLEPVLRSQLGQGRRAFVEIGPHPVLSFAVGETIEEALPDPEQAKVLTTLRREEGGPDRFALSLAEAHAAGAEVQWEAFFAGSGAKRVPLPTYPFQRERYWLSSTATAGDVGAAGLSDAEHPLLGAAVELAVDEGEGLLLTGRISLQTHPWLADHAVAGAVLLPGTAFLELALKAAELSGAKQVEELTLQAPLILPESGAVQIQVSLGGPDEQGRREISIHSRPEAEGEEWACHASGTLSSAAPESPEPFTAWPPEGAEPLEVEDLYDGLAGLGFEYGPAFQGLSAAWKRGEEVFAEVSLAPEQAQEAGRFGLHPALLDSALHGIGLLGEGSSEIELPFSWRGVCLHGVGATALRVRIAPSDGDGISLGVADSAGTSVASIRGLDTRPLDASLLQGAGQSRDGLLGLQWQEVSPAQSTGNAADSDIATWRWQPDPEIADLAASGRGRRPASAGSRPAAPRRRAAARLAPCVRHRRRPRRRRRRVPRPRRGAALGPGALRHLRAPRPLRPDRHRRHGGLRGGAADGACGRRRGVPAGPARGEGPGAAGGPRPRRRRLARSTARALATRRRPARHPGEPRAGPERRRVRAARSQRGADRDPCCGTQLPRRADRLGSLPRRGGDRQRGRGVVVEVGSEVSDLAPGDRVMGLIPEAFALACGQRAQRARPGPRELVVRAGGCGADRPLDRATTAWSTSPA